MSGKAEWVLKVEPQRYTLGVVYEPDVVDLQNDWATHATIEKACREFNMERLRDAKLARVLMKALGSIAKGEITVEIAIVDAIEKGVLGVQHVSWDDDHGDIVESYIAPCEMAIRAEVVKAGTWLMGVVWSQPNWVKVQAGEITGLSLGGFCGRARGE